MKEHDEINVLVFFFQKKNLKMISRYDTMHCEFVYLVNESIFSSFRLDLMPGSKTSHGLLCSDLGQEGLYKSATLLPAVCIKKMSCKLNEC